SFAAVEVIVGHGETARVLDEQGAFVCAITDQRDGAVYDITITISDLEADRFSIAIAETPRG
ncbi:MAG: hypothetical protein AAFY28_05695, partial [Actinomycetota bacterium]